MPIRVFHRLASPTQTESDAKRQADSGELWGRAPRGSDVPTVQAYVGPLPPEAEGIKFTCLVEPDPGSPPGLACWRPHKKRAPGEVRVEGDFARVSITLMRTRYRS